MSCGRKKRKTLDIQSRGPPAGARRRESPKPGMGGPRCTCTLLSPNSDPESQGLFPDPRQNRTRSCPLRSHEQSELPAPTLLGARWDPQEFCAPGGAGSAARETTPPGATRLRGLPSAGQAGAVPTFPKTPPLQPGKSAWAGQGEARDGRPDRPARPNPATRPRHLRAGS